MERKQNVTVLYVDDEKINLFLFQSAFQSKYNVITAISAMEGLQKLEFHHDEIIVVISDMHMPSMDGIEFIEEAKSKYHNIVYFILTAFDYNDRIHEALETKLIQKFFTKPFNVTEIETAINNAVNSIK